MKKLSLVLIGLLLTAAVVSAQATFSVSGSFYASIGADLDNGTTGLETGAADLGIQAMVGESKSVEKISDSDVYGEVMIKGLAVESETQYINGGQYNSVAMKFTYDTIAARLVFGDNFSIGFWNKVDAYQSLSRYGSNGGNYGGLKNAYDYYLFGGIYGKDNETGALGNSWDKTNGAYNDRTYFDAHGFKGTYATVHKDNNNNAESRLSFDLSIPQAFDTTVYVGSWKSWNDSARFVGNSDGTEVTAGDNAYQIGVIASLTAVENLTFKLMTNFDLGYTWFQPVTLDAAQPLSFGALAAYSIKIADDISITPQVAFDGQLPDYDSVTAVVVPSGDGFDFGLAGGVMVALKNTKIALNVGMSQDNELDLASTAGTDESTSETSLNFTGSLSFGLIEGLSVKGAFEYRDPVASRTEAGASVVEYKTSPSSTVTHSYAEDATIGIAAELSYDIKATEKGVITPYVKFSTDNKTGNTDIVGEVDDYAMYIKGGVTLKGFIDNTTFNLEYASNDLSDTENVTDTETLGQIVFKTSISL